MRLRETRSEPAAAGLVELASGVDAIYMSGYARLSRGLVFELGRAKTQAQETDAPVEFRLGEEEVLVAPGPFGRYPYRIETAHGLVGVTDSAALPALRIQPRAEHLHAVGAAGSVAWFARLVGQIAGEVRLSASRLDVFSDWHGLELKAEDRHRFVGRARRTDTHEEGGGLTGFEFGRRSTKTVTARIYNKTIDLERKGTGRWRDLWGPAYDSGRPVTRVEFEFGRIGLRQYGVDSADQALATAPSLYVAASTDWLSLRTPTSDQTRSRWPVDPCWLGVQGAKFACHAVSQDRVTQARVEASLRRTIPALNGYLATFCALVGAPTLEAGLAKLPRVIAHYEKVSGISFAERITLKRHDLRFT